MQGKTINGFSLQCLLGIGGMAEVWYAENKIGKKAAVKILLPKLCQDENVVSRFLTEAKVMVDLNHPNIRQVYDYGEVDGRPAIVMEYLDGDDLKTRMKRGQRFTNDELKHWWNQLVSALNYTHQKGIVHRDIKPGNIFVDRDGNIKLLDFGIAKVRESISSTQTGQKLGTLMYMSPEQVKDSKHIDYRTDVYSLAVTFVHLLTGKKPYDSETSSDFEISEQIVYKPMDLSGVPLEWRSFLEPYLEKEFEKRPFLRSFQEFVSDANKYARNVNGNVTEQSSVIADDRTIVEELGQTKPQPKQLEKESPSAAQKTKANTGCKPKNRKGWWIGLGAVVVAVVVFFLALPNKEDVSDSELMVSDSLTLYNLDYNIYLNIDDARVKERNLMNIHLNESGNVMVNFRPCNIDRLKDEIKKFITPNIDPSGPVVNVIHDDLLGDVRVSNGLICCGAGSANTSDAAMMVNEIAKAYAEIREDLAMTEFHKHISQLNGEQLNAIRKAVPVRVTGIGEYVLYMFEVMADEDVEENLGEINNAFVEVCMEKTDDLERIKAVMDDFDAQNTLWDKGVHSYYFDNYNVIEEVMAELFNKEEEIQEDEIFMVVEEMPDFPGGLEKLEEYLVKNIKYPQKARESGIQGRVFINFVIEPDGHTTNVKVMRGIGGGCDEEAVRVVKAMPRWKPGKQRGKAVRVSYNLPVNFKL